MLKNKWHLLALINSGIILLLISFILYFHFSISEKMVYVDNNKLFEEFRMTKEMRKTGEKEFNKKKATLDSLYIEIQREDLSKEFKEVMMKEFISKRDEFDQFNQKFAIEESSKIWTRISSYTGDFAKNKKYKIVFGSNNKQNILFAEETIDVTKELLDYINKKYSGL